jgi:hypothetical protein
MSPATAFLRLAALLTCLPLVACGTLTGTRYSPHISNTLALRDAQLAKVSVGTIATDPDSKEDVERVMARAMYVNSVYGSYTAYLREALTSELDHADLLDPASAIRIDGVLLRNELGGESGRENVIVEAELTVTRDGVTAYRGQKTGTLSWESVYPGEVAIPRAIANYQAGVQRLIAAFIADPAFVAALKPREEPATLKPR